MPRGLQREPPARPKDPRPMLAYVFRHRARIALVYGRVSPLPLAGSRFRDTADLERAALGSPPERPGQLGFRGRHLEARPMPPRSR
jgi:hypothetical protein